MYKLIEEMRREEREEGLKEGLKTAALRMIADGTLTLEKIAAILGMPLEEVKQLRLEQEA